MEQTEGRAGAGAPLPRATDGIAMDRSATTDPRVARILRCIEERLDDPDLGCDLLQRRFFVSRPTLYRMFQPLGGVSRYIRERRLLAAQRRLRAEPERSITWLLYDLGFESERQFQRTFQSRFGMSPAKYREQCRAEARARGEAGERRGRANVAAVRWAAAAN